jgi:uncharacterized protein
LPEEPNVSKQNNIHSVFLILTAGCNLGCSYCFQNSKTTEKMPWETVRASLDLAINSKRDNVDIIFTGGEPLMEFGMMQKAVAYCIDRAPPGSINYAIATNGLLVNDVVLRFFIDNDFEAQLSFDGISTTQALRGKGTFEKLDRLLKRIRSVDNEFFAKNVKIAMTVVPETVEFLSDSIDYFLHSGVQSIRTSPIITDSSGWSVERLQELRDQFSRIAEISLTHFQKTGDVPFEAFQGDGKSGARTANEHLCGITTGTVHAIDVDGEVYGCATLARSNQRPTTELLERSMEAARIGHVNSAETGDSCREFIDRVKETGIFTNRSRKYSSYGRCRDCEFLADCAVCPASIGHAAGNSDADRVPDFVCAYNLTSLAARKCFMMQITPRQRELDNESLKRVMRAAARLRAREVNR